MPTDSNRLARALKNAAAAGDTEAVARLTEAMQARSRPIGAMSPAEIAQLDPAQHGGIQPMPIGPGEVLAGAPLAGAVAKAALPAVKAGGRALKAALGNPFVQAAGGGGLAIEGARRLGVFEK